MLEKSCQTMEAILGPLLEVVIYECCLGGNQQFELQDVAPPPYDAATCIELLLKHDAFRKSKFPITIRRRLETASEVCVGGEGMHALQALSLISYRILALI